MFVVLFYTFRKQCVSIMLAKSILLVSYVSFINCYDWVDGPSDTPDPCPGLYCGRTDRGVDNNSTEVRIKSVLDHSIQKC